MNSRERVLRVIEHKEVDRVPKLDAFWEDAIEEFYKQGLPKDIENKAKKITVDGRKKTIGNSLHDYFDFDIDTLFMDNSMRFETKIIDQNEEFTTVKDRAGYTVKKFTGKSCSMHFMKHENKDFDDWDKNKHKFEFDPNDTSRIDCESYFLHVNEYPSWEGAKVIFDEYRKRNKFITINAYGPIEGTWRHHGYEETLMDLLVEPEYMHEMLGKITDLTIDTLKYAIELGIKPDAFWIAEDMGGTHTTLFSPNTYKEMIWPYHKKLGDFLHANGIKFMMHSCGKIESLLPDLIEAGLDVIQALQANTGMDVRDLKKQYGTKLTFFGNISPEALGGTFEDIENEIGGKIPVAMKDGGYIYHSDHSIPHLVSFENYCYAMKMLDKYGKYE